MGSEGDPEPQLIYQDEDLVVVYKPAGMLVHRTELDRHETRFLLQWTRDRVGHRLYPVHRLDKPTAGLVLLPARPGIATVVERLFSTRRVEKTYLAVVRGYLDDCGRIDYPLRPQPKRGGAPSNDSCRRARPAVTDYRTLGRVELPVPVRPYASSRYSLVAIRPRTGRQHQIRRHLKHVFHPLIGDTSFGDGRHNAMFRNRFDCHRLLLVATGLRLPHPGRIGELNVQVPPDSGFQQVLNALGWKHVDLETEGIPTGP